MTNTLAIDIGGTKFTLGGYRDDRLVLRQVHLTDRSGGPNAMLARIKDTVECWRDQHSFTADRCGVGFGGPVDFASQSIVFSTHVEGWLDYPLVPRLSSLLGCPVIVDNDANVGALGEARHGAGTGLASLLYITISTGIGGGIIHQGKVVRGADSYAGEIGHMTIDPDGPECLCGARGCLERLCCGLWLERDHGESAEQLMQRPDFVRGYVVPLARGLKAALMLLNPHAIVIGGGISKAGAALFGPLQQELEQQMTSWSHARREIRQAALGDDSVLYGALELARNGH